MTKRNILIYAILFVFLGIVLSFGWYNFSISAPSKKATEKEFVVDKGSTYLTLADKLKDEKLIRSKLAYKIYIKLNNPDALEAGPYTLSPNMKVKDIVAAISKGNTYNPDTATITLVEGEDFTKTVSKLAKALDMDEKDVGDFLNSQKFLNKVIDRYWFVTDEVLNDGLVYALEGYFYPSTYEIYTKDVSLDEIAYKFLDKMEDVLDEYKRDIEDSKYSVHELLALSSIIEGETANKDDRFKVSGVFYNRLNIGMPLQSCVTLGYATGVHKTDYSYDDQQVDSPYNTYLYKGLPIGPGSSVSSSSIDAALHPASHNYYYFMANICDESDTTTYFSETLAEHEAYVSKYLNC